MGLKLGMDEQAVMSMRYGLFMDLLACDAISRGTAKQKPKKITTKDPTLIILR